MKQRPGFETRSMRWVYRILYPYFHCRVTLTDELMESTEPVVFIANHYNIFGPPSFVLSMPFVSSIWLNEELIRKYRKKDCPEPWSDTSAWNSEWANDRIWS